MSGVSHNMSASFLSKNQRNTYGRYAYNPSHDELIRYFYLDEPALHIIGNLRGASQKIGFALLLGGVSFTGQFTTDFENIPASVISYISEQLNISPPDDLRNYFAPSAPTFKRHTAIIRQRFGFLDFHKEPALTFRMIRHLYVFCWTGEDRPKALFLWSIDWLLTHKIILPGISTLERLIKKIRERAQKRLWAALVKSLNKEQRKQIDILLHSGSEGLDRLDILRASPLKRRQTDFLNQLDRLDKLRDLGMNLTRPKTIPLVQLEKMSRIAQRIRPSILARFSEPRRTAMIAALFYTLEASAQDDALELAEALISDLLKEAEAKRLEERLEYQKATHDAKLLLRGLGEVIVSDAFPDAASRIAHIEDTWPREDILHAIAVIDADNAAVTGKPYAQLAKNWPRAQKLFKNITRRIDASASPNGQDVIKAMRWLEGQEHWSGAKIKEAPKAVVSKAWEDHVFDKKGEITDPKAYVFATIDAWHKAIKRRDIFAAPGLKYADPRAGMIDLDHWAGVKSTACRTLGHSLDGHHEIDQLSKNLHLRFQRVLARLPENKDLRFAFKHGKARIISSPLDRIPEANSLKLIRQKMEKLMPKGGIPDILLEIMRKTNFSDAFTNLDNKEPKVEYFETSLCAVLIAQACNIGFEPLVQEDHPALSANRLSWVNQNFIRNETLNAANAHIVKAHNELDIVQYWGDGKIVSADGLRIKAPQTAIHAGTNPKYFGTGRGITWYNMISDQYSGLGAMVVPGTLRDSLMILSLLLEQETELEPHQVMSDNAAYSDTMFGLFWLLGYKFSPRLADLGGNRLWRVEKEANYGIFNTIAEGRINTKLIIDNWDDIIRFAASLKLGHLKAAGIMRILQVRERPTTLAKALMHLGRLLKTDHVLHYIDDADFRRQILVQLNRQEFRHKLARRIYHGERGEMRNALKQGQEEQLGALGLVLNAIVHWNAIYMQQAISQMRQNGHPICDTDISRLSPVRWQHINFLGRYEITLPESVANGGLRPLTKHTFE